MNQVFLYNKILSHCTSEFSPIILGGLKIQPVVIHFTKENEIIKVPVHQHRFAELSWMIDGNMGYQFNNATQMISSETKNFIFIPPETVHQRIAQKTGSNIIGFMLDMVPQNETGKLFYDAIIKFLAEHNYTFGHLEFVNDFEKKLLAELNSENSVCFGKINFYIYEFLFKIFYHYFIDYLIQPGSKHKISYDHNMLVVGVKQVIEEHLSSSVSLRYLAKMFNVSVRHLNRIFLEQTGNSPTRYIIQRKLNAAQKMLYNPKFSVKEITDRLGFNSEAYFCYFFRRQTGMTPLEYSKHVNKS